MFPPCFAKMRKINAQFKSLVKNDELLQILISQIREDLNVETLQNIKLKQLFFKLDYI